MKEPIIIVGSGGHAKSVLDAISTKNQFEIIGLIGCKDDIGKDVNGYKVIGMDEDKKWYYEAGIRNVVIAIGNHERRLKLYQSYKALGYKFPNIIDETAILASHIRIGEGNFIGKGVIVNASTQISNSCILNTGCVVEHDCFIGECVHIAPRATLCGNVQIKFGSHIGAGTTIIQNIIVGKNTIIGAGSVVLKNVSDNTIAYGNPCREVKKL
ncbi:MAG: acetyltransferase [Cellulosilyticaceae bacterium]